MRPGTERPDLPQEAGASLLELASEDPVHHGKTEPFKSFNSALNDMHDVKHREFCGEMSVWSDAVLACVLWARTMSQNIRSDASLYLPQALSKDCATQYII